MSSSHALKENVAVRNDQETDFDFGEKYTQQNPIAQWLIDGFFAQCESLISLAAPESLLEVGCAEGYSTQRLAGFVGAERMQSCDVEQRLVAAAQKRNPDVPITQQSIYDLAVDDDSFDMVVACEVLEHLEDPITALEELSRVTRKWALVSVPWEPIWRVVNFARGKYIREFGNTPGHIQHWSRRGFVELLEGTFKVHVVRSPFPWTMVLAQKQLS